MRIHRPLLALALAGGLLVAASPALRAQPLPAVALAPEPGAYRTLDFDWKDPQRDRRVPVRLYLPEAAHPAAPAPLVVFSHGIGGSRAGYSYLGRYWATQGFASLHL